MEPASSAYMPIDVAALAIEILATVLIIAAIVAVTAIYLTGLIRHVTNPPAHYTQRYRPAARYPHPVDTSTSHIGFRCVTDGEILLER